MMAKEYEKGTLINMVTKGLPRRTILFSKFTGALMLWSISYWLCFFITLGYTLYYFPDGTTENLALSVISLYLFGVLLIAVLLLGAVLFKNAYGPLLLIGWFLMVLFLWNLFPEAAEWNPLILVSRNIDMLQGTLLLEELRNPLLTTGLMITSALVAAVKLFNKTAL
jgi:ABC-2 type transport system permease protein